MHLVTTQFEHISRTLRLDDGRKFPGQQTTFSFSNSDTQHCNVFVDGAPELQDGMTVTAVLDAPGDWQRVLGWYDHRSDKIQVFSKASLTLWPLSGLVLGLGLVIKHAVLSSEIKDFLPWVALCLVSALWLLTEVRAVRKAIRAGALLRKARSDTLSKAA